MFSTVYCHQPHQTYVILNLYTKCVEDNTLPNPMLSVNDSTPLGPIKRHANVPCLESVHDSTPLIPIKRHANVPCLDSVHDSTPLSPILPVYKVHTHFFFETHF